MSRGVPPTQMLGATTPGTQQALGQAAQSAAARQAQQTQQMAIRSREQMQQQQMELARQQGAERNATNMAAIQERARSQEEYRNLLRENNQAQNKARADAQAERTRQFNLQYEAQQKAYKRTVDLEDARIRAEIENRKGAIAAAGAEADYNEQVLRDQAAHDAAVHAANVEMRTGTEGVDESLANTIDGMDEMLGQISGVMGGVTDALANRLDPANIVSALKNEPDNVILRTLQNLQSYGPNVKMGLGLSLGNLLSGFTGTQLPENVTQLELLNALGTEGAVSGLLHQEIANTVAEFYPGIDDEARGALKKSLAESFKNADATPEGIRAARAKFFEDMQNYNINPLIVDTMVDAAERGLDETRKRFVGPQVGLPEDFNDIEAGATVTPVGSDEPISAKLAWIQRAMYSRNNVDGITHFVSGGKTVKDLQTFRDALGDRLGDRSPAALLAQLVEATEDGVVTPELTGLLEARLEDQVGLTEDLEDLIRKGTQRELMAEPLRALAEGRSRQISDEAQLKGLEDILSVAERSRQ